MEKRIYILENLGCANCAAKMEAKIRVLPGVEEAIIVFPTKQLRLTAEHHENLLPQIQKICADIESQVVVKAQRPRQQTVPSPQRCAVYL
jgi:Cd2+/Zn2+-exporting ATPase